jgi:hypothetical protein
MTPPPSRNPPRHPEICGPHPCSLLFPAKDSAFSLGQRDVVRLSLVRSSGHTVVIMENGTGYDKVALAATASLLRTLHFKA